jgi:hypothetical protein
LEGFLKVVGLTAGINVGENDEAPAECATAGVATVLSFTPVGALVVIVG